MVHRPPDNSLRLVFGVLPVRANGVQVYERAGETFDSVATKIDGQRVVLTFFREEGYDAKNTWNVALLVGANRKQKKGMRLRGASSLPEKGRGRGRVGLKALVWAKRQLDIFQRERPEAVLVISAGDDRRKSAYRALLRVGFKEGIYQGEGVLFRFPESLKSNPREGKPILVIGLYSRPDLRREAAVQLSRAGYEDLALRLAKEEGVVHFDMDALPERGDALDHFHEGSAVIAHHLYYDDPTPARGPGRNFFYNVKNNQIVSLAERAGVPLFVFGDHPLRARPADWKGHGFRVYLPEGE